MLDDNQGPVSAFSSEAERTMAACWSAEVMRLSIRAQTKARQLPSPLEGKDTAAQCLKEPDQQGTRWKRHQEASMIFISCGKCAHCTETADVPRWVALTQMNEVGADTKTH